MQSGAKEGNIEVTVGIFPEVVRGIKMLRGVQQCIEGRKVLR